MLKLFAAFAPRHLREFARLVRNRKVEQTDDGVMILEAKVIASGLQTVIEADGTERSYCNIVTTEGLNHLLDVGIHGSSQVGTWYMAPHSGSRTPVITDVGSGYASAYTELTTQYSESTRVAYVESAASGGVMNNYSNPSTITTAVDSVTVAGAGVLSHSTKGYSGSQTLLAVAKYASAYSLPTTGGTLGLKYQITFTAS